MPFRADGTFVPEDADVAKRVSETTASDSPPSAPFDPADASVATQLGKVLASDSPLLTQARTRAAQVANRRGLLNSSLAVQAGEAAAFDVALPIASQEAGQIQQRNLQGRQIASTEGLASRELGSREALTREALSSQERTTAAEIAGRQAVSEAGIAAQERISASGIAAFDREKSTAAVAQIDAVYQQAFTAIAALEDIPAETREAYLTHLAAIRDTNFGLVEQLYNIDLVWQSPTGLDDGGGVRFDGADSAINPATSFGGDVGGTISRAADLATESGLVLRR